MSKTAAHRLSSDELLEIFSLSENATAVYTTDEIIIQAASKAMISYWGKDQSIIGKPLEEAVPELKNQEFIGLLKNVWNTGISYEAKDTPALLRVNDKLQEFYYDFKYRAIKDSSGEMYCILHTANDVTERVKRDQFERGLIGKLEASEKRLSTILRSIPIPLCIMQGPEFIIEFANEPMISLFQRYPEDVIGEPILKVFPELAEQTINEDWQEVLNTGRNIHYEEDPVYIYSSTGEKRSLYLTYHYHPLLDTNGIVDAVLATVIDVTEQVKSRMSIERAEEMLRHAVNSVELGTWHMDAVTRKFIPSQRLKEIFGYQPDEEMTFDDALKQVTDEYREKVAEAVEVAIQKGENYDLEYPIIGLHDKRIHWIRAAGKLYASEEGMPSHFSGTVLDITERKLDELRKNDFIGMVSHELKTPLTSLKAYTQMLLARGKKNNDDFNISALSKIERQVNKMSAMINGFLNVSRLESGKIYLEKQNFNLDELVSEIIEETMLFTSSHTITFAPCAPIPVYADRDKIGHVISNLLSNAIKYSPKRRDIEVKCELIDNCAQVSVKDEGMGIKPQFIDRLFEPYFRVESHHTQHISGFGIGLYISAEIIKRHGGKIWVNSESGKGSTFFFSLPVS
ncbi:MAG TPA: ATP-binding protein [Sphingobacteriaceae bacterium]